MNQKNNDQNLCKKCKYRYRRVFIPLKPEEYVDDEGNRVLANDENIIITNQCLVTGMDVDGEATIECSHYAEKSEKIESFPFFRHFN